MGTALEREIERYVQDNSRSAALQQEASRFLPGGDSRNSIWWPPFPTYVTRGEGAHIYDVDGHERVDLINNMTTLILGHRHPAVVRALEDQLERGLSFPAPSPPVVRWAEIICERLPSADQVRFVNSGTEATLNVMRAARAFTRKEKIGKFEGGYHGAHDYAAVSVKPPLHRAGDELNPNTVIMYEGVPAHIADDMFVMPYNNLEASERIIRRHAADIAAVIVEPVNGQCGMIPTEEGFLAGLRQLADEIGFLLIFDEVISFRVSRGGAQEHYGVTPDLTSLGKTIGGGLPVGAFAGRRDIMALFDPSNGSPRVQHAGTFNGNPMTAAAGIATLERLTPDVYEEINTRGERLRQKLAALIAEREAPMGVTGIASLFAIQCTPEKVRDYRSAATNDSAMQRMVFLGLMNEGYALSPTCAGNISTAITDEDVDQFVEAVGRVLERAGYG